MPASQTILLSGDRSVEFAVFFPLLRVRFPAIDVYKAEDGTYVIPLAPTPLFVFLEWIFNDRIEVDGVKKVDDILDLIRFCGVHNGRLRSELLLHFVSEVKISNCIQYLTLAFALASDPGSAREVNRALGYLKWFFVTNWDEVLLQTDLSSLPQELFLELARLTTKPNAETIRSLKNSIQVQKGDLAYDNDTLTRALLNLLSSNDGADSTIKLADNQYSVHKYVFAVNAPHNQFGLTDKEAVLADTFIQSSNVFEVLLHFIYASDFIASELPPPELEFVHQVWLSGMFYLGSESTFEPKLATYFSLGLNVRCISDMIVGMEEKPYAQCIKDTIVKYAARNISIIAKSPVLHKLPNSTLVGLIEKMA